jgi:hypothetical protein
VQRPVVVETEFSFYKEGEIVNVTGRGFSPNVNVTLEAFNSTDMLNGFPLNVTANATGGINYTFVVSGLGVGNYTLNATDVNYTNLQNFTSFLFAVAVASLDSETYNTGDTVVVSGSYWDRNVTVIVNVSDSSGAEVLNFTVKGAVLLLHLRRLCRVAILKCLMSVSIRLVTGGRMQAAILL